LRVLKCGDATELEEKPMTKHAHWNVKGPSFIALHELFDQVAEHVEDHIDTIAERVTALGGTARGISRETDKDLWLLEAHLHAKR
jgi:starvation-inducible DNA-binding protein